MLTVNSSGSGYIEQPNTKCKFFINCQGHPMTFFGKITVLRSKYCLKVSKSQQRPVLIEAMTYRLDREVYCSLEKKIIL